MKEFYIRFPVQLATFLSRTFQAMEMKESPLGEDC